MHPELGELPFVFHIVTCDPNINLSVIEKLIQFKNAIESEIREAIKVTLRVYSDYAGLSQILAKTFDDHHIHIVILDFNSDGLIPIELPQEALQDVTRWISVMASNHVGYIVGIMADPVYEDGIMTPLTQDTCPQTMMTTLTHSRFESTDKSRYNWAPLIIEVMHYVIHNENKVLLNGKLAVEIPIPVES
jgi:hypothetical protein